MDLPTVEAKHSAAELQHRTREERDFAGHEADLPDYSQKVTPVSPNMTVKGRIQDLLSYLGPHNPYPRPVNAKDTVWLLDNTAYRNPETGEWEAEFVAAVFDQNVPVREIDVVTAIGKKIGLQDADPAYPVLENRIKPFLQEIRPGTQIPAIVGDSAEVKLGPGGNNGISSDLKTVPAIETETCHIMTTAQVPEGVDGLLGMKTFFAEPEGWGVISDIDDTIKVTMTSDPIGILRSTFVSEPTPIVGMPELYARIHSLIKPTSPFFYLSASPYNLYSFLHDFREQYYPHGTIILRDESWMSIQGLLSNLTLGTQDYKVSRMKKINSWIPKRKMICIGDSTQADPESYGTIYREFPGWVRLICIRKVTDIASVGIQEKNEPERFEKAFKDVPRDVWHVFEDPKELYKVVDDLIASEP